MNSKKVELKWNLNKNKIPVITHKHKFDWSACCQKINLIGHTVATQI